MQIACRGIYFYLNFDVYFFAKYTVAILLSKSLCNKETNNTNYKDALTCLQDFSRSLQIIIKL